MNFQQYGVIKKLNKDAEGKVIESVEVQVEGEGNMKTVERKHLTYDIQIRIATKKNDQIAVFISTIQIESTFKDISASLSKIGVAKGGLQLIHLGKPIQPEDKPYSLNLKSGSVLMGVTGRGDPLKWNRFSPADCESGQWYHGDTWDGVVYQPHKNIQWCGFGAFIPNHSEATF